MRVLRLVFVVLVALGLVTCGAGSIAQYGTTSAESSDAAQRAEVRTRPAPWTGIAKTIGLVLLAVGACGFATVTVARMPQKGS